jgi:predicted nucleotidyltransferase
VSLSFDLDSELRDALPQGGEAFLQGLEETLHPDFVVSVLLFGSIVSNEATEVSDVDIIVILDDNTAGSTVNTIRRQCHELATHHLEATTDRNIVEQAVERETGMFQSGFVAFKSDIEAGSFHAIFNTSRAAYVIAPWRTVLASVFESTVSIYGPTVTPKWGRIGSPHNRRVRELARSAVMAFFLAVAQIPYTIISSRSLHYTMEAHKWTLYNCSFHLTGSSNTLQQAITEVPDVASLSKHLLSLRRNPQFDIQYLLLVPLYVVAVHIWTAVTLQTSQSTPPPESKTKPNG